MMKFRLVSIVIGLFILLSNSLFGQNNSNSDNPKDSLTLSIAPLKVDADLNMIVAPKGFVKSEAFNGWVHYQTSTSIVMVILENANYVQLDEGMTEEFYSSNKLSFIKKEKIKTDNGYSGFMYKSTYTINNMSFIRYTVYAGDMNKTLWVSISFPSKVAELVEKELLMSIQSINLNSTQNED